MHKIIQSTAIAAVTLGLAACSVEPPPETAAQPTIIDDQLKVMDQAKALEQHVLDSQNKTDEAMDQQSQ